LDTKRNKIKFEGKIFTNTKQIEKISLLIQGREVNHKVLLPVKIYLLKDQIKKKFCLNRYQYFVNFNLNQFASENNLSNDVFDLYFQINYKYNEEIDLLRGGMHR